MRPLAWMAGTSLLSWLVVTLLVGPSVNPEALFGLLGPLASAGATVVLVERAHRAAPGRVMGVLLRALGVKVVLFGVYVVVMLRVLALRPVPFVISFTCYFIALYGLEALFLRRLLKVGTR